MKKISTKMILYLIFYLIIGVDRIKLIWEFKKKIQTSDKSIYIYPKSALQRGNEMTLKKKLVNIIWVRVTRDKSNLKLL